MKRVIAALLLAVSLALPSGVNLHSPLWRAASMTETEKIALIDSFIATGAFTSPYTGLVMLTENDLEDLSACMSEDLWMLYSAVGSDTQIGVLMIGCAYKLGWLSFP